MIITELNGGFGNQLFQYAIGKQLAEQHRTPLLLDTTWLSSHGKITIFPFQAFDPDVGLAPVQLVKPFSIVANRPQRIIRRLVNRYWPHNMTFIHERHPYQLAIKPVKTPCYLTGYWQHTGYFTAIADGLRMALQDLLRSYVPSDYTATHQSICLHVRRGDYLANPRYHTLPANYYTTALNRLKERVGQIQVRVFSDDPDGCRQHLRIPEPVLYCKPATALVHLAQMSRCSHFIIPNSTFGWWAAWIGRQPDTHIIAPRHWLRRHNQLVEAPGLTQYTSTIP